MKNRTDMAGHSLRGWRLEGSNDGATWTVLRTFGGSYPLERSMQEAGQWGSWFAGSGTTSYRYLQLVRTTGTQDGSSLIVLAEVGLLGWLG